MAKKRNNKKKSPLYLWGTLLVLILGLLGVKLPSVVTDYFDVILPSSEVAKQNNTNLDNQNQPIESGLSKFTEAELLYDSKGWITYNELDKLGRPTGADALINKKMIGTGTKANASIKPPGFISGLSPHGHSRGHLIGNQFGGSGNEKKNLVTIYQYPVNSPYMTTYETKVRQAVDEGASVRYRVTPLYEGDKLMPVAIEIEAKSLTSKHLLDFKVIIPNQTEKESK